MNNKVMNMPDIDDYYDDQLVVHCNCSKLPQYQSATVTDIGNSKILIHVESYKSPSPSINNYI